MILAALAACGSREPPRAHEDFLTRLLANRWDGVGAFEPAQLVQALRAYVDGDHPIWAKEDPHVRGLGEFLFRARPEPQALLPLFGPLPERDDVDEPRLRMDVVASCVAASFIRRLAEEPDPPRAALYDALVAMGVPFAFDRAWGESHTHVGEVITAFFAAPPNTPCPESRAAVRRHLGALLAEWRRRVTDKGTSTFFGIVIRHAGQEGAATLCGEWEGMRSDERVDLLLRLRYEDEAGRVVRRGMVGALLDPDLDVRGAAFLALREHGAPVADLDPSARDDDIARSLPALRRWAEETES